MNAGPPGQPGDKGDKGDKGKSTQNIVMIPGYFS